MGNFSYDVNVIRQFLVGSEVLEFGIDYYQCEDPNRTPEEASALAYAYVERYCKKWCSRDRKDPATRHQRAFDSFVQKVNEKQYFYSSRRKKLDEEIANADKKAQYEAEQQELWKNEHKRVAALREKCIANGKDFDKENKKQLKRKYYLQKIGIGIETCCAGLMCFSFYACAFSGNGITWRNIGFNILFCIGIFLLGLVIQLIFCRPAKRLPDAVFEIIGKKKKDKK